MEVDSAEFEKMLAAEQVFEEMLPYRNLLMLRLEASSDC